MWVNRIGTGIIIPSTYPRLYDNYDYHKNNNNNNDDGYDYEGSGGSSSWQRDVMPNSNIMNVAGEGGTGKERLVVATIKFT